MEVIAFRGGSQAGTSGSGFTLKRDYPMKKMLLACAAAAAALTMASAASAQSTTVNTNWNGLGVVNVNGQANGSTGFAFGTGGNQIAGSLSFTNQGNNPYGYGVSNTTTNIDAAVGGGGYIQSAVNRIGSGAPYGVSGQSITASGQSSDGTVGMAGQFNVNYAGMNHLGYGQPHTDGGQTLDASGSAIQLNYGLDTGVAGNNAGFAMNGSGSAGLLVSSSGASANGFGMGQGQGIFTQGLFTAQGIGSFSTGGIATGNLTLANSNSVIYGTQANPAYVNVNGGYATTGAQVQSWNFAMGGTSSGPAAPPPPQ